MVRVIYTYVDTIDNKTTIFLNRELKTKKEIFAKQCNIFPFVPRRVFLISLFFSFFLLSFLSSYSAILSEM